MIQNLHSRDIIRPLFYAHKKRTTFFSPIRSLCGFDSAFSMYSSPKASYIPLSLKDKIDLCHLCGGLGRLCLKTWRAAASQSVPTKIDQLSLSIQAALFLC